MGSYEILFYNALLVLFPAIAIALFTGELQTAYYYEQWFDPVFIINFGLSSIMGFVLMYSQILCTQLTSALTMVVVGCIKVSHYMCNFLYYTCIIVASLGNYNNSFAKPYEGCSIY
jgi:hypothetical protein